MLLFTSLSLSALIICIYINHLTWVKRYSKFGLLCGSFHTFFRLGHDQSQDLILSQNLIKICQVVTIYKMGITKPCTQLQSVSSSSTQLHPAPPSSTQLHPAPSTSTQLSETPSTIAEPKYCTQLGNFPKFRPKN